MIDKNHLDDYEVVRGQSKDGREKRTIVYRGELFKVTFIKESLAQYRRISIIFFLLILLLHLAAGFINNAGMGKFYIAIPYTFAYLPLFLLARGIFNLPADQRLYQRRTIDQSFKKIKSTSFFLTLLFMAGIFGEIIFLLTKNSINSLPLEIMYLALETTVLYLAGLNFFRQKNILISIVE